MIKYRGYYIDGVVFKTKKDIDKFVRDTIIKKAKQFNEMLASGRYNACEMMKISEEISIREKRLHEDFGMTYTEIENVLYG